MFYKKDIFILLFIIIGLTPVSGQQEKMLTIDCNYSMKPVEHVIGDINKRYGVRIFSPDTSLNELTISIFAEKEPLPEFLGRLLKDLGYNAFRYSPNLYIILPETLMDDYIKPAALPELKTYILEGYVLNAESGDFVSANIYFPELEKGTLSRNDGYYRVEIPGGRYNMVISAMGLESASRTVVIEESLLFNVELMKRVISLEEVTVIGYSPERNIRSAEAGLTRVSSRFVEKLPSFMGEPDILKSLLSLPGTTSVGEGSGGFNVRGGSADQNLIMLDDVPMLNPSHLFGLFSVFNSDAIQNVTFYRGGIPSRYGGRLSSVLDIRHKEASNDQFSGYGGIGIISARLSLEIPVVKESSSLMLSGRTTYSDWILSLMPDYDLRQSKADFYDISMKYSHTVNSRNRVYLTSYHYNDMFKLASDTLYRWGTTHGSLKWSHSLSEKMLASFTVAYSDNHAGIDNLSTHFGYRHRSNMEMTIFNTDWSWQSASDHLISWGLGSVIYRAKPGEMSPSGRLSPVNFSRIDDEHAVESHFFVDDEWKPASDVTLKYGFRYSLYHSLGPAVIPLYDRGSPMTTENILNYSEYDKRQIIKSYSGFEPRVSASFMLMEGSSLKAGYNRMLQYIHLISNTSAIKPMDIWKLSNYHVMPQRANQFTVGYFRNFSNGLYETSMEAYYKKINRLIDYKDGARLTMNKNIETELLEGIGRAYGLELLIRKNRGKLTGWLGYTVARSERKVDSEFETERINRGNYYPADFDKTHELGISAVYQASRRWNVSFNYIYSTGRPVTYPIGKYMTGDRVVPHYSERNRFRIPDYHRLDLSVTLDGSLRRDKKWHGNYTFSLYNLYGRKNTYSVFFREYGRSIVPYKLSVIGTIIPSFTYNFRF